MPIFYLQGPPDRSYKIHKELEAFFMQDRDQAFNFRVRTSERLAIINAYYIKPNGQEEYVGKFSHTDVDAFVSKRNQIYQRYGRKPQPRVYEGGEYN